MELSLNNLPIPWYSRPDSLDILCSLKINNEIKTYIESILINGYAVIKKGVDDSIIQSCITQYEIFKVKAIRYMEPSEAGKFRRIVNIQSADDTFSQLFSKNKALEVLDTLFAEPATLYTSLFFEIGSAQNLHRDTPYFWTKVPHNYFGVWVSLDDVDGTNGCLEVLPKSHLVEEEDRDAIGKIFYPNPNDIPPSDIKLWDCYQDMVLDKCSRMNLVPIEIHASPGDVIIWHPQTMHGGKRIKDTSRSRLSIAMHVTPKNIPVYHNQAFFNSNYKMLENCNENYDIQFGREIRKHDIISLEHRVNINIKEFF